MQGKQYTIMPILIHLLDQLLFDQQRTKCILIFLQ